MHPAADPDSFVSHPATVLGKPPKAGVSDVSATDIVEDIPEHSTALDCLAS